MELIGTINGYINDFVWGVPCIVLIMGVGLYLTISLKGMQFRHWGFMIRQTYVKAFTKKDTASEEGDITSFQAAMVSVSAVVGSGNIAGGIFAVLTAVVIFGGITRIGEVCGLLSPFMAGAYLLCGLLVIILNIGQLPSAIAQIFSLAFNPQAAGGGLAGASITMVMRYGLARGIFSNEAGVGTAAITHASAKVNSPGEQAIWGPLEVFVDTIIVCTISGLTIVMSGLWDSGADGAALTMRAFDSMLPGSWGSYVVLGAVMLFGFSCLISWYNYVEKAGESMWGPKCKPVLKILWLVFIMIGSYSTLGIAWDLADTANGLMIIPNLIGILLLSKEVVQIKNDFYETALPADRAAQEAKKTAK